jgi:hypothetical protein
MVLNQLYEKPRPGIHRLRLKRSGETVGWAVLLKSDFHGHKFFGNLSVGTVVDALAKPIDMPAVARCAAASLEHLDVDLIMTNQTDIRWIAAFRAAGFLSGPSNYGLTLSKELTGIMHAAGGSNDYMHFTRGDGDGIVNLTTQ